MPWPDHVAQNAWPTIDALDGAATTTGSVASRLRSIE